MDGRLCDTVTLCDCQHPPNEKRRIRVQREGTKRCIVTPRTVKAAAGPAPHSAVRDGTAARMSGLCSLRVTPQAGAHNDATGRRHPGRPRADMVGPAVAVSVDRRAGLHLLRGVLRASSGASLIRRIGSPHNEAESASERSVGNRLRARTMLRRMAETPRAQTMVSTQPRAAMHRHRHERTTTESRDRPPP